MTQFIRDNHFVPQWYLKNWAHVTCRVWSYRLLVSHQQVRPWELRAPRGLAFHDDLYTTVSGGTESDDFEHWLEAEFEAPARAALARVLNDLPLAPHHWQHLGRYAVSQQLRTPQHFLESMQRWNETAPALIQETLERSVEALTAFHESGVPLPERPAVPKPKHLDGAFKIVIRPDAHPERDEGEIGVEMLVGRELWIREQRHVLDGVGWVAARHSWSIVEPAAGATWFTSDQPVVLLNYNEDGWDLKGGWGRPRGNILMPLSPRHLLFTQIGEDLPPRIQFNEVETRLVSEILAQRAHRMIFAQRPVKRVERLRPRVVDAIAYQGELDQWKRFHDEQTSAQARYEGW